MKPLFKPKSNFFDRLNSGIGGLIPAKGNAFGRAQRANTKIIQQECRAERWIPPEKKKRGRPKKQVPQPEDHSHLIALAHSGDEKRMKEVIDGQKKEVDAPRRRRAVPKDGAKVARKSAKSASGSRSNRAKKVRQEAIPEDGGGGPPAGK